MDKVAVKKEFHESNAKSTTYSPGTCQDPVTEPIMSNNATKDPRGVSSPTPSELYCDITIKSEEIQLPDCTINSEEMESPDCSIDPEETESLVCTINSEVMQLPDCTINPEEIQPFDCTINPKAMQLPHYTTNLEVIDCTINREAMQLPDCTMNPEEVQPLDCTINLKVVQLPDCTINPEEVQPLDCTTSPREMQPYSSDPVKYQLHDYEVKPENFFVPYKEAGEPVNFQPYKLTVKPEKFEVIDISDDADNPDQTLPLESQKQIQLGIKNVKGLKLPEPSVEEDLGFRPERMKIIPGKLAVCGNCGFLSMDFNRCFRCRLQLPPDCKAVDAQDAVTEVLDKSKMKTNTPDPQLSGKESAPDAAQEPLKISAPVKKARHLKSKRSSKRVKFALSVKENAPAAAQEPLKISSPVKKARHLKSKQSSEQLKPSTVKCVPGKAAVCPYCGFFSMNLLRCNQPRCRRLLPKNCLVVDAPGDRRKPSLETKKNISLESKQPESNPEPSSNQLYQCSDCPFRSNCRKSYLYHKQFHRSRGGAAVFKCPICSYNVSQDRLLQEHIILHRKNGSPAPERAIADVEEAVSAKEGLMKTTNSASAVQRPKPSPIRSKSKIGRQKSAKRPAAINLKGIPGTFTICPHCNRLSANSIRCSRSRCRKALPTVREVLDKSGERYPIKLGARRETFRCSECPFMNRNKTKYLHHKKFHLPGGTTNFKCTICSYNVAKRHSLILHYRVHGSDNNGPSSTVTDNKGCGTGTEQLRSERSARKSIVSYAEADSTDDETDRAIKSVIRNEATVSLTRNDPVVPVRNEPSPENDPNEWEFVSSGVGRQEEDAEKQIVSDEFIFCYECEQSWKGDCPKHGALVVVEDSEVPIHVENEVFAIRTAPSRVRIGNSGTPGKAKGIFARETLPSRLRFGPLKGKLGSPNGISTCSYTWLIRKDGKPYLCVDLSDPGTSCWWRYVRIAQNVAEMNCAAYQYQGRLYIRTLRQIPPKEELVVGPYDHNGLLIKYDPELVKKPKVSSWVFRSLKRKYEERRQDPKESSIYSKIRSKPFSPKSSVQRSVQNGTKKEPFACPFCSATFLDISDFNVHLLEHTGEKPYKCSECGFRCSMKAALSMHMRCRHSKTESTERSLAPNSNKEATTDVSVHAGKQSFVCNVCNQAFRYSFALTKHSCGPLEERPFTCTECNSRFARKGELKVHFRQHTGEKPYVCRVCSEAFPYSSSLKKHSVIHTRTNEDDKPFKCTVCNARFSRKGSLNVHLRVHIGEKPYVCKVCDERFAYQTHLKKHSAIHAEEKSHVCTECNERFSQKDELIAHSRVHTSDLEAHSRIYAKEKLYKCDLCPRQFSHRGYLTNHFRSHAVVNASEYMCLVCGQGFQRVTALQIHSLTHKKGKSSAGSEGSERTSQSTARIQLHSRENQFACNVCSEIFHSEGSLMAHGRFHSKERGFECKVCNKRFFKRVQLKKHFATHTLNPFECKVCNKQFSRKDNFVLHKRRFHSGEKPFPCTVCDERFIQKFDLMIHVKLQHKSEQPYVCKVCNEGFSRLTALQIHSRIHGTRERLFACTVCSRRYFHKHNLSIHLRTHSGVKPFECNACSRTFTKDTLHAHRLSHTGVLICIECNEQFSRKDDFFTHPCSQKGIKPLENGTSSEIHSVPLQSNTEGKPFACSKCPMRFFVKSKLIAHQVLHSDLKCPECPLEFALKSQMERHILKRHAKPKQSLKLTELLSQNVSVGDENTNLHPSADQSVSSPMTYTIRIHRPEESNVSSREKLFECPVCPRTFTNERNFRSHVPIHA